MSQTEFNEEYFIFKSPKEIQASKEALNLYDPIKGIMINQYYIMAQHFRKESDYVYIDIYVKDSIEGYDTRYDKNDFLNKNKLMKNNPNKDVEQSKIILNGNTWTIKSHSSVFVSTTNFNDKKIFYESIAEFKFGKKSICVCMFETIKNKTNFKLLNSVLKNISLKY